MSDLAEYIKNCRHFDGLGMGDKDLEARATKLQAQVAELEAALKEITRLTAPGGFPSYKHLCTIAIKALKQEDKT